jgi:hypothetical protein
MSEADVDKWAVDYRRLLDQQQTHLKGRIKYVMSRPPPQGDRESHFKHIAALKEERSKVEEDLKELAGATPEQRRALYKKHYNKKPAAATKKKGDAVTTVNSGARPTSKVSSPG